MFSRLEYPVLNKAILRKAVEVVELHVCYPDMSTHVISIITGTNIPFVNEAINYYYPRPYVTLPSKTNEEAVLTVY